MDQATARKILLERMADLPSDLQAKVAKLIIDSTPPEARQGEKLSLHEYVKKMWPVYIPDPTKPFEDTWHIGAICEHLQAVDEGQINRLLLSVPPRCSKSSLVSVMWPSWRWTIDPGKKYIFTSYTDGVSHRDSILCRMLIRSNLYQATWGHVFSILGDMDKITQFANNRGGWRIATTISGKGTGAGCDILVMDDPHNIQKADSDKHIEAGIFNFTTVMSSRVDNPTRPGSGMVVSMQRVRENDLIGHLLKEGGWEILSIPMEYEPKTYVTCLGWKDPRTTHGELMWPARFTKEVLEKKKQDMGEYEYAGQYQQRPTPAGGGLFKKWHFRFWVDGTKEYEPVKVKNDKGEWVECKQRELPTEFDLRVHSWDCAFKDNIESDPVSGQVWYFSGASRFLLQRDGGRKDYATTKAAIRALCADYPSDVVLVEDKANGPAIISELSDEVEGLMGFPPPGVPMESKMSRARRTQPSVEAGNCYLPHPEMDGFDWVWDFIKEHIYFGKGEHDDDVDAHCQAAIYAKGHGDVSMWGGTSKQGEILNG